jgi:hypothetical protein
MTLSRAARQGFKHQRRLLLGALVAVVPLGFYSKHYTGPAQSWVNDSLGGIFYELFWIIICALLLTKVKPWRVASGVLMATCVLELLQLTDLAILQYLRGFYLGRVLVGDTFVVSDFFYYIVGCCLGWLLLEVIAARTRDGLDSGKADRSS